MLQLVKVLGESAVLFIQPQFSLILSKFVKFGLFVWNTVVAKRSCFMTMYSGGTIYNQNRNHKTSLCCCMYSYNTCKLNINLVI